MLVQDTVVTLGKPPNWKNEYKNDPIHPEVERKSWYGFEIFIDLNFY